MRFVTLDRVPDRAELLGGSRLFSGFYHVIELDLRPVIAALQEQEQLALGNCDAR